MMSGDAREGANAIKARFRVRVAASAADRTDAAVRLLRTCEPGTRVLIVGASRGAADDLARRAARLGRATFGIDRASLAQVAARAALDSLSDAGLAPSSWLGAEAVAARAVFEVAGRAGLGYLAPVASTPGFSRALARTLLELRLDGIGPAEVAAAHPSGPDLAVLLAQAGACLDDARSADRAAIFRMAADVLRRQPVADTLVLLDITVAHPAERAFIEGLTSGVARALATVPAGDRDTIEALEAIGGAVEVSDADARDDDLSRVRRFLFDAGAAPERRAADGSVQLFSAPGEGREAVEIARRLLAEARRGVPFDAMAVLVRSPDSYVGLIEQALSRAGIPAWFDRGTRRPDPAGRALLALLACADERLSASRFAEYLSLGQVPAAGPVPAAAGWTAPFDELLDRTGQDGTEPDGSSDTDAPHEDEAGALPAPWRWERLLAEASVIGRDAARWRRRLDGRQAELRRQIDEIRDRDGADDARVRALERTLEQLEHLRSFALPVVDTLAVWPEAATWGTWLDAITALAPRVLRRPASVLRVLADLRPMADVGPIDLAEVRRVLGDRLLAVESGPAGRRAGRVFVGTPEQARGRGFRVVFVPGLAERMFPQKPREDPLLLDGPRAVLSPRLATQHRRLTTERLQLQLAVGAAADRLYVSYPRIDLAEARARVPSFYALEIVRAITGEVPDHEVLERQARDTGSASLAWPAPERPEDAIDEQEHDLAVLRRLLDESDPSKVRGHAHYLLKLNEALRRSVIARWRRGEQRWSAYDGIPGPTVHTQAALAARRLSARSYSASALQRFSACPYQFVLNAFYRLQPLVQPEPLQQMDPLTRGSLFHEVQHLFLTRMRTSGALPVTEDRVPEARRVLDAVIAGCAARAHDLLAPAVQRVWDAEIAGMTRDLHAWLDQLAGAGGEWVPAYFEWAFGAGHVPGTRDPASVADDAIVGGRFRLRGAIDLVEVHQRTGLLRVTDHKTGRVPDRIDRVIVGGGAVLQPVLYPLAIEAALGRQVEQARLSYCTSAGGYHEHVIPVNERTRAAGLEILEVIDRAIETGTLVAAPAHEACDRCDFRAVCGPDAPRRARRKPQALVADLADMRSRP